MVQVGVAARGAGADEESPREVWGWSLYDWAISAFSTTVVTVLLGPYLTELAQAAVGERGTVLSFGPFGRVTAESFFPLCVSASVLLQVLTLPVLGAVADFTNAKKRLLAIGTTLAATATAGLALVVGDGYLLGGLLFIAANLVAGACGVLYNAFLPEICPPERRDAVSSRGFAMGYLGGGLLLAANLALVASTPFGLSTGDAVRLSFLSAGIWWGVFGTIAIGQLRSRSPARTIAAGRGLVATGTGELRMAVKRLRSLPETLRFLVGYALYNDGIQTVIALSSVFLSQELFVRQGRSEDEARPFIIGVVLLVQFVAFGGALGFGRVAARIGAKRAILATLALWCAVVIYAYGFLATTTQAWAMAVVIALALGGSQALSRSLYSRLIPAGGEATFFGLYELSQRATAWVGPLIFGIVVGATGSYRQALLSLIVLFAGGMVVLALTDTGRAEREASASRLAS